MSGGHALDLSQTVSGSCSHRHASSDPVSYREAIDTLYLGNHLSFASSERFVVFTRSIPQPRLASIIHITIAYNGKDNTILGGIEIYRRNCENEDFLAIISAMPRLKVIGFRMRYLHVKTRCFLPKGAALLLDLIQKRTEMTGCELWYEVESYERWRRVCGPYDASMDINEFFVRWRVGEKVWLRSASRGVGFSSVV